MILAPPSKSGITNSPIAGIKTRIIPVITPGNDKGNIICQNIEKGLAQRSAAASITLWFIFIKEL